MGSITLLFTSLGLSMDACAVSISNGMCYDIRKNQIFSTATTFGFFQALMPVLGYFVGSTFSQTVASFGNWLALIILSFIGGKMIFDAAKEFNCPEDSLPGPKKLTSKTLFLQAIATSIDAFAVGVGFAVIKVDIVSAALSIGIITFINSIIGSHLGKKFGQVFKQKAEVFGGIILIGIGIKIFLENTL